MIDGAAQGHVMSPLVILLPEQSATRLNARFLWNRRSTGEDFTSKEGKVMSNCPFYLFNVGYLLERQKTNRRSDSDSGQREQSIAQARVVAQPAAMCRHHHVIARLIHHAETSTLNPVFVPDSITIAFY